MARRGSTITDAHAISRVLDHIDHHLDEYKTPKEQKDALLTVITAQKLEKKYAGYGLSSYKEGALWGTLDTVAQRHKRSDVEVDTANKGGVAAVFKLGSALFERDFLDTIRSAAAPVALPPRDVPQPKAVLSDRRGSRRPSEAANIPGRRISKRTLGLGPVGEERDGKEQVEEEEKDDSHATPAAKSGRRIRKSVTGEAEVSAEDSAQAIGAYKEDMKVKEEILDISIQSKNQTKGPGSRKHAAAKSNLTEVDSDESDSDPDVENVASTEDEDGEEEDGGDLQQDAEDVPAEDEIEDDDGGPDVTMDDDDASSDASQSGDREEYDDGEDPAKSSRSKSNASRPGTPGPAIRDHSRDGQSESDEEYDDSEASPDSSDNDDDSSSNSSDNELTLTGSGEEKKGESEADPKQLGDDGLREPDPGMAENGPFERDAGHASDLASTERRSRREKLKPAHPTKRSSRDAFDDAQAHSDPHTPSKKPRTKYHPDDSAPKPADRPAIADNDTVEGSTGRLSQGVARNGLTNDEIRDDLQAIKQQVAEAVQGVFNDTDDKIGSNVSSYCVIRARPDLEAVYEHIFGTDPPWFEAANKLRGKGTLRADNLLRSMIASLLLTKILDQRLPWEVATALQQHGHQFSSLARILANQEVDTAALLWQAVQHQLQDPGFTENTIMPAARRIGAECIMTLGEHLRGLMRGGARVSDWHTNLFTALTGICHAALVLKSKLVASGMDGWWVWYHTDHEEGGRRIRRSGQDNGCIALSVFPGLQGQRKAAPLGSPLKVNTSVVGYEAEFLG